MQGEPITYDEVSALYDQHADDPELESVYREALARIETFGEHAPTDWKAELRAQWERDIKDDIEFFQSDIGLLSETALTFNDETVAPLAKYLMWCEMEMLQELYKSKLPEWLR